MDARKTKIRAHDLPGLFAGAVEVVVCRGRKSVSIDLARSGDDFGAVEAAVLGRSRTLKAPSVRVGTRWLVGFGEPGWTEFFRA